VDDMAVYFDLDNIKNQILEINPEYKFELKDSPSRSDTILCARI
jgi:lipocalin